MNIHDIDAVILCGGLGKRLRSVCSDKPKVLADFEGQPFLDLLIEYLKVQNIERIILCTGYKAEQVENYYRDKDFGIVIDFSREEEPLGTGGALRNAQEIISSETFLVLNGDSFCPADLSALCDHHEKNEALASIVVSHIDDKKDFGGVVINDNDEIVRFEEKKPVSEPGLVNAGIYCFQYELFAKFPDQDVFSLERDVFPQLIGQDFYGYKIREQFYDIGTPERYAQAQQALKGIK